MDILKSTGPTFLSWNTSHETRITEHNEIDMPQKPAWPEIEIMEKIPIDDVFCIQEDHPVAGLGFKRPPMKTAQPAKFKYFLSRESSATCSRPHADIDVVVST